MNATAKRVHHREKGNLPFKPIISNLEGKNICLIDDLKKLVDFHFLKYKSPFINTNNSKNEECTDFRFGNKFKRYFISNLEKFGDIGNYFVNIFIDDTKICNKKVKVVYMSFLNDIILPLKSKSVVYSICTIDYSIFHEMKNTFYEFLVNKLINEIELIHLFNNVPIKGNVFTIICDNLESMDILNLKNNFMKEYKCRICHSNVDNVIEKLDNIVLKSNSYYIEEFKNICKDKRLSKINKINSISPFIYLENFDYISSVVLELQHCENEGELYRDLVLFFVKFPQLIETETIKSIILFLNTNFNVKKKKITNFFQELDYYKTKVIKDSNTKTNEETNEEITNETNEETNEEITNETNINKIIKSKEKKKKIEFKGKKKPLGSSDISYFFNSLVSFFYNFFIENKENDIIKIMCLHYKYYEILNKNCFKNTDLLMLDELIKERIKIFSKNQFKIVPKTILTKHFSYFIEELGPIKYFTSFIFENHNHVMKRDVSPTSKNLAITSLSNNYSFFEYQRTITIPKAIFFTNNNLSEVDYIKISNHLIKPIQNVVYLGFFFYFF
jgi:hypothetical protein